MWWESRYIIIMVGSFLPSLLVVKQPQSTRVKEPTLLCNQVRRASKLLMALNNKDDLSAREFPGILIIEMLSVRMTGVCCCPHPTVTAAGSCFDWKPAF